MNSANEVPEATPDVAAGKLADGTGVVVDVREHEELAQARIDGAIHIPLGELHLKVDEIPRNADVYLLCHVGQRSAMATDFLRQLGYTRVWNIQGGIIGWARGGHPFETGDHD